MQHPVAVTVVSACDLHTSARAAAECFFFHRTTTQSYSTRVKLQELQAELVWCLDKLEKALEDKTIKEKAGECLCTKSALPLAVIDIYRSCSYHPISIMCVWILSLDHLFPNLHTLPTIFRLEPEAIRASVSSHQLQARYTMSSGISWDNVEGLWFR